FRGGGSWRSAAVCERAGTGASQLPSIDLAEPASRFSKLRTADSWDAGRASTHRRLSAGAHPSESRAARRAVTRRARVRRGEAPLWQLDSSKRSEERRVG